MLKTTQSANVQTPRLKPRQAVLSEKAQRLFAAHDQAIDTSAAQIKQIKSKPS